MLELFTPVVFWFVVAGVCSAQGKIQGALFFLSVVLVAARSAAKPLYSKPAGSQQTGRKRQC
mgnify:CR=1 FL=1